jgi:NAD(P)-dependent dehydrogenase (short-subunit alcohol dehydrogenase family)
VGRAIAEDFGGRGASVVVNDINADGGQETVRRIEATGGTATFIQADVSAESEVAGCRNSGAYLRASRRRRQQRRH